MIARPSQLSEVASRVLAGDDFALELADFLHEFTAQPRLEMLAAEPPLLRDQAGLAGFEDAYLAAVAAQCALNHGWPAPQWTQHPQRVLPHPWFSMPGRHMRALLLQESPVAFRARNLFVTANALDVA